MTEETEVRKFWGNSTLEPGQDIITHTAKKVPKTDNPLDAANLLPYTQEIGENTLGHAIEGGKFNEPPHLY